MAVIVIATLQEQAVVLVIGNGGGGAQYIDDNSGVRTIWPVDGVWYLTSNVEIGHLHGHDLDQRASQ